MSMRIHTEMVMYGFEPWAHACLDCSNTYVTNLSIYGLFFICFDFLTKSRMKCYNCRLIFYFAACTLFGACKWIVIVATTANAETKTQTRNMMLLQSSYRMEAKWYLSNLSIYSHKLAIPVAWFEKRIDFESKLINILSCLYHILIWISDDFELPSRSRRMEQREKICVLHDVFSSRWR